MIMEYIHDIFGWIEFSGLYHDSLVDCADITAFDGTLQAVKERLDQLESSVFNDRKSHKKAFHTWFVSKTESRVFSSLHLAISFALIASLSFV